ncbi:MAG: hypothetical protein R3B71_05790 [Candidatus Gracilibacteria bacterium]
MTKSEKKTKIIIAIIVLVAIAIIGYLNWSGNQLLPGGTTEGPSATVESSAGL